MTTDDHKRLVKDKIHIVESINLTVGCTQTLFSWIGADLESDGVKCTIFGDLMQLCPPKKKLESNLMAHINGTRHCQTVEEIAQKTTCLAFTNGKRGRPSRSIANIGPTTKSLHNWFSSASGIGNSGECFPWDKSDIFNLMWWGFRDTSCLYGGKFYVVKGLLDDPHHGKDWYPEPHLKVLFHVREDLIQIDGSF